MLSSPLTECSPDMPQRLDTGSQDAREHCPCFVPPDIPQVNPKSRRSEPYLAEPSDEQRKFLDLFAYLERGEGAPRGAILSRPRRNGKTALLRCFIERSTPMTPRAISFG